MRISPCALAIFLTFATVSKISSAANASNLDYEIATEKQSLNEWSNDILKKLFGNKSFFNSKEIQKACALKETFQVPFDECNLYTNKWSRVTTKKYMDKLQEVFHDNYVKAMKNAIQKTDQCSALNAFRNYFIKKAALPIKEYPEESNPKCKGTFTEDTLDRVNMINILIHKPIKNTSTTWFDLFFEKVLNKN